MNVYISVSARSQLIEDVLVEFDLLDVHGLVADAGPVLVGAEADVLGLLLLDLFPHDPLIVLQGEAPLAFLLLLPLPLLICVVKHPPHVGAVVLDLLFCLPLLLGKLLLKAFAHVFKLLVEPPLSFLLVLFYLPISIFLLLSKLLIVDPVHLPLLLDHSVLHQAHELAYLGGTGIDLSLSSGLLRQLLLLPVFSEPYILAQISLPSFLLNQLAFGIFLKDLCRFSPLARLEVLGFLPFHLQLSLDLLQIVRFFDQFPTHTARLISHKLLHVPVSLLVLPLKLGFAVSRLLLLCLQFLTAPVQQLGLVTLTLLKLSLLSQLLFTKLGV